MSKNRLSIPPPRHQAKQIPFIRKIVKYVNEIPGIRYRELLRMTGLSNGVLSYHLRFLDNTGRIRVNRVNNRVTRYFSYVYFLS